MDGNMQVIVISDSETEEESVGCLQFEAEREVSEDGTLDEEIEEAIGCLLSEADQEVSDVGSDNDDDRAENEEEAPPAPSWASEEDAEEEEEEEEWHRPEGRFDLRVEEEIERWPGYRMKVVRITATFLQEVEGDVGESVPIVELPPSPPPAIEWMDSDVSCHKEYNINYNNINNNNGNNHNDIINNNNDNNINSNYSNYYNNINNNNSNNGNNINNNSNNDNYNNNNYNNDNNIHNSYNNNEDNTNSYHGNNNRSSGSSSNRSEALHIDSSDAEEEHYPVAITNAVQAMLVGRRPGEVRNSIRTVNGLRYRIKIGRRGEVRIRCLAKVEGECDARFQRR